MNAKNLEFLKEGMKYLGFGEGLNNKLTEELNSGMNISLPPDPPFR